MGKQYNKVLKRKRRTKYNKRKQTRAKAGKKGKAAPVPEAASVGTPGWYTAPEPKQE